MLIYAGTKSEFMIDTENDCLETKLYENIKLKMVSTRNGMLPYSVIVAASETVCTPITNTVAMTRRSSM